MSGGKGGDSGGSSSTTTIKQSKPSPVVLPKGPFEGLGFNLPTNPLQMGTPATGQGLTPPAWAAPGSPFAMDWWGQQAPNVGAALLQQQGWGPWAQGASTTPTPPTTPGATTCPDGSRMNRGKCVQMGSWSGGKGGRSWPRDNPSRCAADDFACLIAELQGRLSNMPNWASHGTQG